MKTTQTKETPSKVKSIDGGRGKRGVVRELFEKENQKPAKAARALNKQDRQQTQDRGGNPEGPKRNRAKR